MSTPTETFRLSSEAAEYYEARFVPGLFAGWCEYVVAAAAPRPGEQALDVACGTGVVARGVAERVGPSGSVTGLDINPAMLAVARRVRPEIDWREGDAAELPFPADSFDLVTCQAALMFFPDAHAALHEMARVVRASGRVVLLVPGRLASSPAYVRLASVAEQHVPGAGALFGTYFALGDITALTALVGDAGLRVTATRTDLLDIVFPSIGEFVATEVGATPLADRIDRNAYGALLSEASDALSGFVAGDGSTRVPIESHVVTAVRAG